MAKSKLYHNPKGKTVKAVEIEEDGTCYLLFSDGLRLQVHPDELTDDPDVDGEPTSVY